jgi:hypothetical protein
MGDFSLLIRLSSSGIRYFERRLRVSANSGIIYQTGNWEKGFMLSSSMTMDARCVP